MLTMWSSFRELGVIVTGSLVKYVETFLIHQFEVHVIARNQHIDDVVSSPYCIMERRISLHVLHEQQQNTE